MNRRTFAQSLAASAAGILAAPQLSAAAAADKAPPYGLSVMLWTVFRHLPFEQRLEKVAEAGYTNVELVGEYSHWSAADFTRANETRKRLNIRFDATAGLKHGLADATQREAFLTELTAAFTPMETLSCPAIIVLSGNAVEGRTRDEQHASCIEGLKRAASLVEGRKIDGQPVKLLLECIDPEENPHYFLPSAAEAIEIVRAVNHPQVQFLYDLFHEQIAEGNLIEKITKNIDVISLFHIADVPGRHQPGTGEINYGSIFKKLSELNYRGMVAMEFIPTGDEVEALRAARQLVAASV